MAFHKDLTGSDLHDPKAHAGSHTNGTDDIQDATTEQKGLMTVDHVLALAGHLSNTENPHGVDKAQVGLGSVLDVAQVPASEKAAPNGVATLDSDGRVPVAQLNPVAITTTHVVASEAAQLALDAQEGDVAVRTDLSACYIHNGGTAGTIADWTLLLTPTDAVQSVDGLTGNVSLSGTYLAIASLANDISFGSKVGIGTSSPNHALHVKPGSGIPIMRMDDSAGTQKGEFTTSAGNSFWALYDASANLDIKLDTNGYSWLNGGGLGIGTTSPTALLDVNANKMRLRTAKTPASATDTGNAGDICWDADYVYVCVATNTWKRAALVSW